MDLEILKQLQSVELGILDDVVKVCDKHGLVYFLDCGTLLGAIRHDGFIPWDDDIDIAMPSQDYFRFLEIAQDELGVDYFVQNYDTEDNYDRSFAKVRKRGTKVVPAEWKCWDIFQGAWIDIFPMFYSDSEKETSVKRFLYNISKRLQTKNLYKNYLIVDGKTPRLFSSYVISCVIAVLPLKLRKRLKKALLHRIFSKKKGRYLCRCGHFVRQFDADCFMGEVRYHQFEHCSFRIPSGYDQILRTEYGNYMELPPEDQRGSHGEMEVIL